METVHYDRLNLKVFVAVERRVALNAQGSGLSYRIPADQLNVYFSVVQLLLYILGFATMILIFLYIAYERPPERPSKKEEAE